jgi:hypothetical protein
VVKYEEEQDRQGEVGRMTWMIYRSIRAEAGGRIGE